MRYISIMSTQRALHSSVLRKFSRRWDPSSAISNSPASCRRLKDTWESELSYSEINTDSCHSLDRMQIYQINQKFWSNDCFNLSFNRCGFRGGYCEVVNFDAEVMKMLYKCISVKLCPAVTGQTAMECVVNPPKEGEPSYANHCKVSSVNGQKPQTWELSLAWVSAKLVGLYM